MWINKETLHMTERSESYERSEIPSIDAQLKAWRRYKSLRQEDLETLAELSHNTVSRIETGVVSPKLETLEKLAEAMEISIEQLQFRSPPAVGRKTKEIELDELITRIQKLPKAKRDKLLQSLHAFLDIVDQES